MNKHFSLLTNSDLEKIFEENNIEKYRSKQIMSAFYERFVHDFDSVNNIPKNLKEILKDNFLTDIPITEEKSASPDGTCKYLLKLEDGNCVECVYLPYSDRKSLCISCQVGCPIGCRFCASGVNGFVRNLKTYEILGQILAVQCDRKEKISHIVFMGIGEPLLNLDNILKAVRLINTNFNISQRRITLSTSGITAKIYELADRNPNITLALSLHSPFQDERCEIIPSAIHNTIPNLMTACDEYFNKTKRRITWEYILINNLNCDDYHSKELAKLARKHKAHINLIPCNETDHCDYKAPSDKQIKRFAEILKANNINFTLREKKGANRDAACGQLRNRITSNQKNNQNI